MPATCRDTDLQLFELLEETLAAQPAKPAGNASWPNIRHRLDEQAAFLGDAQGAAQ